MHKNDPPLTEQQSLQIIQQMIQSAKQEQKDDGMGWIIWGWLLFSASVLTVLNIQFRWFQTFFFWNIFGLAAVLLLSISIIRSLIFRQKKGVRTYIQDVFEKLNIGFAISLLLNIIAMNLFEKPTIGFALLTGLYGFWILIYGALLDFKPSVIAAYILFALALATLFLQTFKMVMLLHSIAILIGYLIPGYIANAEFKKVSARTLNKSA